MNWNDRVHFFAIAARQMQRILVDHARNRGRQKRSGGAEHVELNTASAVSEDPPGRRDRSGSGALPAWRARHAQKRNPRDVLLRRHDRGGVRRELQLSEATVNRELKMARAWMHTQLA